MRIIILTILSLLIAGSADAGPTIVSVQSVAIQPYEKALSGFQHECHTNIQKIVISELNHRNVTDTIRSRKPDLVLAIGLGALQEVKGISEVPIIYMMVLNPTPVLMGTKHISGVSMNIPQKKQLSCILSVIPDLTTISMVYHPENTGDIVRRNQQAAQDMGIRIRSIAVNKPEEVADALTKMRLPSDALWLLPDVTVVTPETLEFLFNFSLNRKIPLISFSEKYLELGAFMSIGLDLFDMGRQTGRMANKLLSGTPISNLPPVEAQKAVVTINRTIGEKLGISMDNINLQNYHMID